MADAKVQLTHGRVLKIALPIVAANITVPILGVVDTGVVGQLGHAAPIGAVGIGAIILTSVYWIFGFLRMGTVGMTSQALGANDTSEVLALLTRALMVAWVGALLVILFQMPIFWAAFEISPASPEVENLAREYMRIRIYSAPATISLYAITGWLIAKENTRAVFILQAWINGLNICLDLWFVLGLGWGVQGVAWATFIAEWSGFLLGIWYCRDWLADKASRHWSNIFDRVKMVRMAVINTDIMIRSVLLQIIFVSFLFAGSTFGDVTLAANQILIQFLYVTAFGLDGFAFAAEVLVGTAMGAGKVAQLRRGAVLSCFWGLVVVVLMTALFWLFGPIAIEKMTTSIEVQTEAKRYLPWMIAAPLIGIASWMLDGIFIGATRSRDMRNMMALSTLIYGLSLLVLLPSLGNHGLWLALMISFIARGVTLAVRYPALERAVGV